MASIQFFSEDTVFRLKNPNSSISWIRKVIRSEGRLLLSLNYIFCSDAFLLNINTVYLKHKTLTDIITFDYSESHQLNGEIYISIERVKENATKFNVNFDQELHRVMIHGVLHLLGYGDKKPLERIAMREKEEACLSLRK